MITRHNVCNVWPKTTLLLPGWCRDDKRLDTPADFCSWAAESGHQDSSVVFQDSAMGLTPFFF